MHQGVMLASTDSTSGCATTLNGLVSWGQAIVTQPEAFDVLPPLTEGHATELSTLKQRVLLPVTQVTLIPVAGCWLKVCRIARCSVFLRPWSVRDWNPEVW